MAVIYKVKLTRQATTDEWPLTHVINDYTDEFFADPTGYQNPLGIPSFGFNVWPRTPGFLSYAYEEYDTNTDSIASDLINSSDDSVDKVNESQKLVFNPNSLTLTSVVSFDNLENLTLFVNMSNTYWLTGSITKSRVQTYLIDKGITVEEEIYIDGTLNTTTGLSCFDFGSSS
jgi:hypothetical protein